MDVLGIGTTLVWNFEWLILTWKLHWIDWHNFFFFKFGVLFLLAPNSILSVWANCSLKVSDLELEGWLLHDVLSVKYPGCGLKRGGFVQLHLPCPCVCLQPASQQLGVRCGFIHLNTTAAFKSWAGGSEQGKWSDGAKSELCSSLGCGEEASSFPVVSCWFDTALFHSSFLLPARCFCVQDESFLCDTL